jgi:hypothetical protein
LEKRRVFLDEQIFAEFFPAIFSAKRLRSVKVSAMIAEETIRDASICNASMHYNATSPHLGRKQRVVSETSSCSCRFASADSAVPR